MNTQLKPSGRPVRAARAKRSSLASGFIDSSTLKIDSDDEGDENERPKYAHKRRFDSISTSDNEDDFATARTQNSAAASSRESSSSPSPEPEPMPWELKYYPKTHSAVEKFRKILGAAPPDTNNLNTAAKAIADALIPVSLNPRTVAPKKLIVKLRLPPGSIDKNASFDPKKVGFMDFPGELRNQIYLLALKDKKQINFKARTGFSHSAGFLGVNKTVYNEARKFLYGENRFIFDQSTSRLGSYFENHWKETNYGHIRQFLTSIGPENISLITDLGFNFEDATPSGHPGTTMNSRRYERNQDLYWILKKLARHGKLEKLKLGFSGRRALRFSKFNAAFLYALAAVKTDKISFGDPHSDFAYECHWDSVHYGRVDIELKDTLKGVMVRPQPLKLLDPRLEF